MTDRNVEFPNRFRLVKVAGTDDIYDLEAVPGKVTAEGTFFNKETLLKDATAAAVKALVAGATTPDTPNDATNLLAQAVVQIMAADAKIQTGSYVGTGTYGASNKNTLTFNFVPKFVAIIQRASPTSDAAYMAIFTRPDAYNSYGAIASLLVITTANVTDYPHTLLGMVNNKTLIWYSYNENYIYQLNATTDAYYIAIG